MLDANLISSIRQICKVYEDWLVYVVSGPEFLTPEEASGVVGSGLPIDKQVDLASKAFALGKLSAHYTEDEYSTVTAPDLSKSLSVEDRGYVSVLQRTAEADIRRVAASVSTAIEKSLENGGTVQDSAKTLFSNIFSLVVHNLMSQAKNQALLACIAQEEGVYKAGLSGTVALATQDGHELCSVQEALSKSIRSYRTVSFVPPGCDFAQGETVVTNPAALSEYFEKATAGVSGGISSTVTPKGPPQPKTVKSPGSIKGLAAPGNAAGPGRGHTGPGGGGGSQGEFDDYKGPSDPQPTGPGWEQNPNTGGWRHRKGVTGGQHQTAEDETEYLKQRRDQAIAYGKQPRRPEEVMSHLNSGKIVSVKKLGQTEAGVHNAFLVTTELGGRGLMKPTEHQTEETHGNYFGTGFGSVPRNNSHGHEAGAYQLSTMLGGKAVPPTTTRSYEGDTHSMQAWAEDHMAVSVVTMPTPPPGQTFANKTEYLLSKVPDTHKEQFEEQLHSLITLDIVMNNNDRHKDNVLVNKDNTELKFIDHSDAFGTGMKGVRNDFHYDLHRMGKKVSIPEKQQASMRTKTLGDYKRSLSDHLPDWQVGQTYLRAQYALHLQDNEGHLDYNKFLPTLDSFKGGTEQPLFGYRETGEGRKNTVAPQWRKNNTDSDGEFLKRQNEKTLPNDLFESFAKQFIQEHKSNPSSPYHQAATELDEIGVFMPAEAMQDPKAYRREGKHKQYEQNIEAKYPPKVVGHFRNLAHSLPEVESAATIKERRRTPRSPISGERRKTDGNT
jgi:hypothetical protein